MRNKKENLDTLDECIDYLHESPENALEVYTDSELGNRYYAMIEQKLIHHPGTFDGSNLGIVGQTSNNKLSYDVSEYDIRRTNIKDTPLSNF